MKTMLSFFFKVKSFTVGERVMEGRAQWCKGSWDEREVKTFSASYECKI